MKFIDEAKQVLRHAWSIRLALIAAIFSAAEVALPFFDGLGIPQGTMAAIASFVATGAAISRIIAQPKMRNGKQ